MAASLKEDLDVALQLALSLTMWDFLSVLLRHVCRGLRVPLLAKDGKLRSLYVLYMLSAYRLLTLLGSI